MLQARTLKILALLLTAFVLLALPAYFGPASLEELSSHVVIVPILSMYFFQHIGVPGLFEHGGHCGWGMCAPTVSGWAFLAVFWILIAWLVAWAIAGLTGRSRGARR